MTGNPERTERNWESKVSGRLHALQSAVLLVCLVAALGIFGSPRSAMSETIQFESNEHPLLSRLILHTGEPEAWSLDRSDYTYRLTLSPIITGIDTSTVKPQRSGGRILNLRTNANVLTFDVVCACEVSVYTQPGGHLVVDVTGPVVRSGFALPRVLDQSIVPTGPVADADGITLEQPEPVAGWELDALSAGFRDPELEGSARKALSPGVFADTEPPSLAIDGLDRFGERSRISAATETLSRALERASASGLIERADQPDRSNTTTDSQLAGPTTLLPLPINEGSNLRVSTSTERDLARLANSLTTGNDTNRCLGAYDLDVSQWGDPQYPLATVVNARSALFDDLDVVGLDAARTLVKAYLFASFGAEARAVLSAFPLDGPERAVFGFLAEVMDGQSRPATDKASVLVGCAGPAAMWGLLSVEGLPVKTEVAKSEIASAFSALPLHLRLQLGPRLVERFLDLQDPGTARAIWNSVDRAESSQSEEFILATAALHAASGDVERAESVYARLEAGGPGTAPEAVVRLIASVLARNDVPQEGILNTADALSFETRGTPVSRDLKFQELRGRIASDHWDRVFESIPEAEFDGILSLEDRALLMAELYVAMSERADTETFLLRAFEARERLPSSSASDPARRAIAHRATTLGFGELAYDLLQGIAESDRSDLLARARADLVRGRPRDALFQLEGLSSQDADVLRAQAHMKLRDFRQASVEFRAVGEIELAAVTARRYGDWSVVEGALEEAALKISRQAPRPDLPELAGGRLLADTANQLRKDIGELRNSLSEISRPQR